MSVTGLSGPLPAERFSQRLGRALGSGLGLLFVAVAATLFLASIIHVAIVLMVPRYVEADGYARVLARSAPEGFRLLPASEASDAALPGLDPLFAHAVCRIDLSRSPAGVSFDAPKRLWTLALYDRTRTVVFSLNDRTSLDGAMDMLVVSPVQAAQLRETPPADIDETIVVESEVPNLVAIARLYAPDARSRQEAETVFTRAECAPAPFEQAPAAGGTSTPGGAPGAGR